MGIPDSSVYNNVPEQSNQPIQLMNTAKLKQKRRDGQITTEQFEALQAKAIIDI